MSCEVKFKCDHCGAEVSPYIGKQWRASMLTVGPNMDDIHACSKEHLGFAIAKAFDIGIDGKALELIAQRNMDLRSAKDYSTVLSGKIKDLEAHAATLTGLANQYKAERDSLEETCRMHSARVVELEKEVVYQRKLYEEAIDNKPPALREAESDYYYNAAFDGVDYGKAAYERFRELPATPKDAEPWDRLKGAERNEWRAIVEPVVERVRAEKNVDVLQALKARVADITEENNGFRAEPLLDKTLVLLAIEDAIASITNTEKPTKPLVATLRHIGDRLEVALGPGLALDTAMDVIRSEIENQGGES